MKKLFGKYLDERLFEKKIWDFEKDCYDQWKSSETPDFKFYFKIFKVWTLSGIYYRVEIPNMYTYDKNLFIAINRAIVSVHDNGAKYYRLVETLRNKGLWKSL